VGKSTGWRPCHLEIARRNCMGGGPASMKYHSVRAIYFAR
jgi:predicted N-acyltransferase